MSAAISIAGFIIYLGVAAAVQAMHPDEFARAPISAYLKGPASGWLQSAYYVLAASLVSLGVGIFMARPPRRHIAAGCLLWIAGCSVVMVAWSSAPWPMPGNPTEATRRGIHNYSSAMVFLAIPTVMFLETTLLWRRRTGIAVLVFAVVVFLIELAASQGTADAPRIYGALQKFFIIGLVSWLIAAGSRIFIAAGAWERAGG